MTGFASLSDTSSGAEWAWEARSVNSRGLDIRSRLPEGMEKFEPELRRAIGKAMSRGSVTVNLKVQIQESAAGQALNGEALEKLIATLKLIDTQAQAHGLPVEPVNAVQILNQPGIAEHSKRADLITAFHEPIMAGLPKLLDQLVAARTSEGKALVAILGEQIDRVDALLVMSEKSAGARAAKTGKVLKERVATLLETTDKVDEERLAQELALIAVKADVTEEIDRLKAHVASARDLLNGDGPAGRKLDFLMQEFNREANTLCSKSSDPDLTNAGLELKVVIDQMREQCQNVE